MVEGDDHFRNHEKHVRYSKFVLRRGRDRGLEPTDAIVAQVTDCAAVKERESGIGLGAVGGHPLFKFIERIALRLECAGGAIFGERESFSCGAECGSRPEAQKRKAAGLVFLFGGLEEKRRCLAAKLRKGRNGRIAISDDLAGNLQHAGRGRFLYKCGARRGDGNHVKETFGACLSAALSTWKSSAAANWKRPAIRFVGKSSRFVL